MTLFPKPRVRARRSRTGPLQIAAPAQTSKSSWQCKIIYQPLGALTSSARQLKKHSEEHIASLTAHLEYFQCVAPIIVDRNNKILKGHVVYEACKRLGLETIPTVVVDHLDDNEVRALRLSLSKLSQVSTWNTEEVAKEFAELFSAAPDLVAFTGFKMPEIDAFIHAFAPATAEPAIGAQARGPAVSRIGDLFLIDSVHKLLCGDARDSSSYQVLLGDERVQMVLSDPPYSCPIKGHASRTHDDFVEGAGLSEDEALAFFEGFLAPMVGHLQDGAVVDLFIDWRGMHSLVDAARSVGLKQISHCVWDKGAGGMGSLYRQRVEHALIFKWGKAPHINNIRLGRHGRNRTTLWSAPGLSQFGRSRKQALDTHPTVKPVGLLVDALLDTSEQSGLILDPFAGSGSSVLAAHRARRVCRAMELDPKYVDAAVRRFIALGLRVQHAATGLSFEELEAQRTETSPAVAAPAASSSRA